MLLLLFSLFLVVSAAVDLVLDLVIVTDPSCDVPSSTCLFVQFECLFTSKQGAVPQVVDQKDLTKFLRRGVAQARR